MAQLTLPGFEAPTLTREHRLFFAVMPDPATAARIDAFARRLPSAMRGDATPLRPERLHITLFHLGDFAHIPEVIVARACAAAGSVDVPAFDVTFDRISSFNGRPGQRPLVLTGSAGLSKLIDFQQRLGATLRGGPARASRARFTPHLTLLYGGGRFDPREIEPLTWTAREFVLIYSWVGKTHYEIKGCWPLGK